MKQILKRNVKMFPRAFYAVLLILFSSSSFAQGFFNQKGEMIKKLIEQIGLLGTYARQAKQGYNIIDNGLKDIRKIKKGEFDLHDGYYESLKTVDPDIKGLSGIDAAIATGRGISTKASSIIRMVNNSTLLGSDEKKYLRSVLVNLIDRTEKELQTLSDLLTNDKLQLTDDERIRRINDVSRELSRQSTFLQQFSASVKTFLANRKQIIREQKQVQQFYNLKD